MLLLICDKREQKEKQGKTSLIYLVDVYNVFVHRTIHSKLLLQKMKACAFKK